MIADQWENHLFNNIFVLLVFGLDNMDNDSDGEFEGDLNSEGDEGCNNCNDLLDEMKDRENNFDVRILKLEEAHQLQITELQKHHIEELGVIKKENQDLQRELERRENNENEMKRQIDFLSGMLRETNAKKEDCIKAAKEKQEKQNAGSSVTTSISRIVGKGNFPNFFWIQM